MTPFNLDLVMRLLAVTVFWWPFAFVLVSLFVVLGLENSTYMPYAVAYSAVLLLVHAVLYAFTPKGKKVDWDSEIVLITGGSSGIGELVAEILSVRQVTVVVLDIQELNYSQCADSIAFYKCDVSDRAALKKTAARIVEEIGNPTILINNAGIVRPKLLLDSSDEDIEATVNVNLIAQFWTIREFLPYMLEKNHGHIVTVASATGMVGAAQAVAYSASKYGLIGMHESIRQEILFRYKKPGIQTTLLCPGLIHTKLFRGTKHRFEFLTPGLEPVQVAKEIVKVIDQGISSEIHMPFYVRLLPLLRMVPLGLNDLIHEFAGANTALLGMTEHNGKGRTKLDDPREYDELDDARKRHD